MNQLMPAMQAPQPSRQFYESDATYPTADVGHPVTLRDLLRVLRVYGRAILVAAAAGIALSMVVVSLIKPTYLGTALVMVDEQQRHILNEQTDPSVLSNLPSNPSSIESQVQMLQSHALASQIVDKLNLTRDPEFNGTVFSTMDTILGFFPRLFQSIGPGGARSGVATDEPTAAQQRREQTIGKFLASLDVQAVGLSTVIAVNFRSTSAQKAARIANAIADTYIDNLTLAKSGATEGASKWLADRVAELGRQASAADASVQKYKAENGLVDASNGVALTDQRLGDLTGQLVQAEGDQAQAEAKLARVHQLVRSSRGADVTDAVASPLISQLREQEATLLQQRADLSSRYGPLHPSMLNIEARLRELKQKISEEVNRIIGTASNDAAVAAARVGAIKSNMARATSDTAIQNRARVKLGELSANASSARAVYQSYLDRLKQTQQRAGFNVPDVHVVSSAPVPLGPVAPKKLLIVGGASLAGLVLGFLAALVADRMCNGFRSVGELELALDLPVLATIPEVKTRRGKLKDVAMEVLKKPQSAFSEALRGLEIGLSMQDGAGQNPQFGRGKVILVTSALPSEGKTSTTVSLARRLSASGHRVVIVDADQRRAAVAGALGLRMVRFSLGDYLARRCSLDEALSADPHSSLVALAGSRAEDETDLNGSSAMASLIERLRDIADFVVIDSPPVLAVHDAKILAPMTDGTIFVVRWGKTPREAVSLAVKLLRDFRVKFLGTALVRTDNKNLQYYTFGYTGVPALAEYYKN
jgi:succinoglycan biosynthesis transport protein ExoP